MKVAVWDTYVRKPDGAVMHFDVVVPDTIQEANIIYDYARKWLEGKIAAEAVLNTENCQFCHIEHLTTEMKAAIEASGYSIIEMEDIPPTLPEQPSRRDMILHLRGHFPVWRYADFKEKTTAEIMEIIQACNQ